MADSMTIQNKTIEKKSPLQTFNTVLNTIESIFRIKEKCAKKCISGKRITNFDGFGPDSHFRYENIPLNKLRNSIENLFCGVLLQINLIKWHTVLCTVPNVHK